MDRAMHISPGMLGADHVLCGRVALAAHARERRAPKASCRAPLSSGTSDAYTITSMAATRLPCGAAICCITVWPVSISERAANSRPSIASRPLTSSGPGPLNFMTSENNSKAER